MMVYRSLVVGLLLAIAMLVAARPPAPVAPAPVLVAPVAASDAIVDVSRSASGDVLPLLGLGAGERIVAVDDLRCFACEDALLARWREAAPGEYLDLAIGSRAGERRVLLLVHR